MAKKRWTDLTRAQQNLVCVAAALEGVLTAIALRDLATRPSEDVRGSRAAWALGCILQPVGPLAYLAYGRKRD